MNIYSVLYGRIITVNVVLGGFTKRKSSLRHLTTHLVIYSCLSAYGRVYEYLQKPLCRVYGEVDVLVEGDRLEISLFRCQTLAERVGFEPTVRVKPVHPLSRRAPSTSSATSPRV